MTSANQVLEKAASYIGIQGTDNIFNTWYWGQHVYDPNSYPWCAAFVSYVLNECGMPNFKPSASASGVAFQFQRIDDSQVQPADIAIFNWDGRQDFGWSDHIGIVEWSDINGSGYFGTIEGNTGPSDGGEVMRQTRYNWGSYGTAFFRPVYDGSEPAPAPAPSPEPAYTPSGGQPYYNVYSGDRWQGMMIGLTDTTGSADDFGGVFSFSMRYIAIGGVGRYRVYSAANGWLPWVDHYDINDFENGCAGDGSDIQAVEIEDGSVHYMTRNLNGGWNSEMIGNHDTGGSSDPFAGIIGVSQDAIKIWR